MLYTIALNKKGELVQIDDAKKGVQYYCPSCKNKFTLRKSGNTGKGSRRPHFAHHEVTPNCTPEGVLHFTFKRRLVELLSKLIEEKRELIVDWQCKECSIDYTKLNVKWNLLAHISFIEEEYNLKFCRPDIALLDIQRNVLGVIEIVVTHEPEINVIEYLVENGITLIQINVSSEEDLFQIEEKIKKPDLVNYCINPKCSNLNNHKSKRQIDIIGEACPRCKQKSNSFRLLSGSVFGTVNLKFLNHVEQEYIKSKNVRYIINRDTTSGFNYPVPICQICQGGSIHFGYRNFQRRKF